jgi:hypothetical protein
MLYHERSHLGNRQMYYFCFLHIYISMITCFLVDWFLGSYVQNMCGPSGHLCLVDAPSVYGEFTLYNGSVLTMDPLQLLLVFYV